MPVRMILYVPFPSRPFLPRCAGFQRVARPVAAEVKPALERGVPTPFCSLLPKPWLPFSREVHHFQWRVTGSWRVLCLRCHTTPTYTQARSGCMSVVRHPSFWDSQVRKWFCVRRKCRFCTASNLDEHALG